MWGGWRGWRSQKCPGQKCSRLLEGRCPSHRGHQGLTTAGHTWDPAEDKEEEEEQVNKETQTQLCYWRPEPSCLTANTLNIYLYTDKHLLMTVILQPNPVVFCSINCLIVLNCYISGHKAAYNFAFDTHLNIIFTSCGTSCKRSRALMWSKVSMDGDRPPWRQKIWRKNSVLVNTSTSLQPSASVSITSWNQYFLN